ncbi:sterol O-acyltransferase, variant 2 [Coprinopsis cinerea AmutBmut pab1-1]|nr:sterol O-acyltransferase, variant 2 [Coprinopsis cinerea AmutBmut pab1-1]
MTRSPSDGFETSTGTLYVSKPYRSRSSKKLRALITFTPRHSAFDINNETSHSNEFRGFFSLFWISIFIFTVQTYVRSIETSGKPLDLNFAAMFSQDAITLALSDLVLVLCTGICVPFAIALKNEWIQYYWTGVIIQHLIQSSVLAAAVTWTFNRNWPWVQSGYLTLHALVMVMKMHSYMNINGHLQSVHQHSREVYRQLKKLVAAEYRGECSTEDAAWDKALEVAHAARIEKERKDEQSLSETDSGPSGRQTPVLVGTPPPPPHINGEGSVSSFVDAGTASALRKRLAAVTKSPSNNNDKSQGGHPLRQVFSEEVASGGATPTSAASSEKSTTFVVSTSRPPEPHPLIHHPNPEIAVLAEEYSDLLGDLTSRGPKDYTVWPANIGWKDFAVYQCIPTLVYELEYPRTEKIRPFYVFEKTVATFGTFALLYTVTDRFILPYTPTGEQSFLRSLLDLALPFMIAYLLLFYIIFECICNGFAELS